jgi:GNAT superfamily N-acetyltransferase
VFVRTATAADREFVLGLSRRFAEFEMPPWRTREMVAAGTAARLDEALASMNDRSTIFLAEEAGEPLGFAWVLIAEDFYTGRDVAKLSEIAVVRDGTGAGAELVAAFERWARERGCSLLTLNVMEHNAHARSFYERHGFAPEYTLMAKELDAD